MSVRTFDVVTRRRAVGFGLSAALPALIPLWPAAAQAPGIEAMQVRFLQWCRTATGLPDYPAASADAIVKLLLDAGLEGDSLLDLDPDSYRGTALEKSLLAGCYTGVFDVDGVEGVRLLPDAVMWRAAGLAAPPGLCSGPPETWSAKPSGI